MSRSPRDDRPAAPAPQSAPAATWRGPCSAGIGQTLITLGVVVLLFVVYEVYVTDLFGQQKQAAATDGGRPGVGQRRGRRPPSTVVVDQSRSAGDRPAAADAHLRHRWAARGSPSCTSRRSAPTTSSPSSRAPTPTTCTSVPATTTTPSCPASRATSRLPGTGCPRARRSTTSACWPPATPSWWRPRTTGSSTGCCRWRRRSPTWDEHASARTATASACRPAQYAGVYGREITVPSDYAQVLPVPHVNSTDGAGGRRAADHPDHLPSAVLRRRTDDHPRRAGEELREVARIPAARAGGELTMYTWIWRHLPGPTAARTAQALLLFLAGGGAAVLRGVPLAGAVPAVRPGRPGLSRRPRSRDRSAQRRSAGVRG